MDVPPAAKKSRKRKRHQPSKQTNPRRYIPILPKPTPNVPTVQIIPHGMLYSIYPKVRDIGILQKEASTSSQCGLMTYPPHEPLIAAQQLSVVENIQLQETDSELQQDLLADNVQIQELLEIAPTDVPPSTPLQHPPKDKVQFIPEDTIQGIAQQVDHQLVVGTEVQSNLYDMINTFLTETVTGAAICAKERSSYIIQLQDLQKYMESTKQSNC